MKYFVSCDYVRRNLLFACLHVNAKMMSDGWAWKLISKEDASLSSFSLLLRIFCYISSWYALMREKIYFEKPILTKTYVCKNGFILEGTYSVEECERFAASNWENDRNCSTQCLKLK